MLHYMGFLVTVNSQFDTKDAHDSYFVLFRCDLTYAYISISSAITLSPLALEQLWDVSNASEVPLKIWMT